jgi:hypothetical protein
MKVNKEKFIEAITYLKNIEQWALGELDLSEFTTEDLTEKMSEWNFTGLSNKQFIECELLDKED